MPSLNWSVSLVLAAAALSSPATAASTYLNDANISVVVGAGTSAGTFNNTFASGATIGKVIDAPSALAEEFHNQQTHIWFTAAELGGGLELRFDFQIEYDLRTLHFWNYDGEGFDVDSVTFTFFDGSNALAGSLSLSPALGSSPAIKAQDITLAAPLNVRYVTTFLSGTNGQVDFQNIGFTADVSNPAPIPEPSTWATMSLGALAVFLAVRRRRTANRLA